MAKPKYHETTIIRCINDAYSKTTHMAGHTQHIGLASGEPYSCTCKDFKAHKECIHMTKAVMAICAWNSLTGIVQTTPGECPECYGPTREGMLFEEITTLH